MLAQLSASGFDNTTIVVLMSDHGYALGEHNQYSKYNVDETRTRVALIIAAPGHPKAAGLRSAALLELIVRRSESKLRARYSMLSADHALPSTRY